MTNVQPDVIPAITTATPETCAFDIRWHFAGEPTGNGRRRLRCRRRCSIPLQQPVWTAVQSSSQPDRSRTTSSRASGSTHWVPRGICRGAEWSADIDYMYTVLKKAAMYIDVSQEIKLETTSTRARRFTARSRDVCRRGQQPDADQCQERRCRTCDLGNVFNKLRLGYGPDVRLRVDRCEDVSPMTSFTFTAAALTTWRRTTSTTRAASVELCPSHRVTLRARAFAREFWGDNTTRFTLMGFYSEGQPNTYTFD